MSSKSKTKGSNFERDVARLLTDTLQVGNWQRTPNSGAYTGKSNAHRIQSLSEGQVKHSRGDIIAPDNVNLIVECKCYAELQGGFHSIMYGQCNKLDDWIDEVYFDSENGKIPHLLIFKITSTRGFIFVALPKKHFDIDLSEFTHTTYINIRNDETYLIVEWWVMEYIKDYIIPVIKN